MIELTTKQIAVIERPHKRMLWGREHDVHPIFIRAAFGNGDRLLALTPINTCPEYYVVRIDSEWALDNRADGETLCGDNLDEVYEAIAEQCGEEEDGGPKGWPVFSSDSGSTWGEYHLPQETEES